MMAISIIIVTFNSLSNIKLCLSSIDIKRFPNLEVIIVDNGSSDGTVSFIKSNYPEYVLIENTANLGSSRARNQAIRASKGEWILALDSDVILDKEFLNNAYDIISLAPLNVGAVQPKVLNAFNNRIYTLGILLTYLGRFYDLSYNKKDGKKHNVKRSIFGASSTSALYRRKMLDDTKDDSGYFDESFFFLAEDVDLAFRSAARGWRALYDPELICYHSGNSSQTDHLHRKYFCWRNRKKLLSKMQLTIFRLFVMYLFYDIPRDLYLYLANPLVRNGFLGYICNPFKERESGA
ncbi:MAG: glycosyltransferase family 2 protein [Candidatus Omnitrophota bacterium]